MSAPLRFPVLEPDLGSLEERYVTEAIRSGWVSSIGPFVERFERSFAERCGVTDCIGLANGTVALHLALVARGIGPGDEVIVPDLTFAATAAAVVHAGATPVLVDACSDDWNIDVELLERAMTPRTKAVIPVHLYGCPVDVARVRDTVGPGVFILEDAAEAHGATIRGETVGGLGDAACFSFYGNKLVTMGEGGAITTRDPELARRARFLKDHAMSPARRYFHTDAGFNYRVTNLQAALGCAQLERLDETLAKRAALLGWYREELDGSGIALNPAPVGVAPVCWVVAALLRPGTDGHARDGVATRLRALGIDTRPFFVPMHELPPYAGCRLVTREAGRSVAHDLAGRGLGLPTSARLTRSDVAEVASALRAAS
jgi:perosamine synthetase